MKKGIMAMEGLEDDNIKAPEDGEAVSDEAIEGDAAEARADVAETDSAGDAIEEAESIGDALDANIERVEDKVSREEPLSEDAAEAIEVAVEHFRKRLGYDKKVVPSLEGFKSTATSLDKTKELLGNLKEMRSALDGGLTVAQEGLFTRMTNAIERAFTSCEKIERKLPDLVEQIKSKGAKADPMSDVAWARIFATISRKVDASAVKTALDGVVKFRKESEPLMMEFVEVIEAAARALSNSRFIAKDEEVEKIKALGERGRVMSDKLHDLRNRYMKKEVDATPLTPEQAEALAKQAAGILNDPPTAGARDRFNDAIDKANYRHFLEAQTRLGGVMAADIRAYHHLVIESLRPCYQLFAEEANNEYLIVYALYKYIKASTK